MARQYLISLTLNNGLVTGGVFDFLLATDLPAITLTGDVTGSGSAGSIPTTLKNTGTPGTYGQVTVDAQGRVTAGATCDVSHGGTGATSLTAHGILLGEGTGAVVPTAAMTNGQLLVGQTGADPLPKTLSGDAALAASGALTLANSGVTAATYGDATHVAQITVDAKGRITAASNVAISGGGGSSAGASGDVQQSDGAGGFLGNAHHNWDDTNHILTVSDGTNLSKFFPSAAGLKITTPSSGPAQFSVVNSSAFEFLLAQDNATLTLGINGSFKALLDCSGIGANRTYTFQDASGTVAFTNDGRFMAIGNTVTSGTASAVLFVAAGPVLQQNASKFVWDDANARLGVNLTSPGYTLDVSGAANTPGTAGATYRWNATHAKPASTQTLVGLPLTVYGQGTISDLLGEPDQWCLVNINGTDYVLPAYVP